MFCVYEKEPHKNFRNCRAPLKALKKRGYIFALNLSIVVLLDRSNEGEGFCA